MMKMIPMRSYQYLLICKKYYMLDVTIYMRMNKRYLIQMRSQVKTSGTILPKVHGVNKGVDARSGKQMIKPLATSVQSHVPAESKGHYHVKPRLGQGRAGIKKKMLRFPIPQLYDKAEQPKLFPGSRLITQITERPILQSPWIVA